MKHITRPDIKSAEPELAPVLAEVKSAFGQIPDPFTAHLHDSEFFKRIWSWTRNTYFAGRLRRDYKDVIAGAVSKANECTYCLEAHTMFVNLTDKDSAKAILSANAALASDAKARELIEWGLNTLRPETKIIQSPPFDKALLPEIIFTALTFHYMNRFVFIFFGPSPMELPKIPGLKALMMMIAGPMMKSLATKTLEAEAETGLIASNAIPADLNWATSDPVVLQEAVEAAKAAEAAGAAALSQAVRDFVMETLQQWRGGPMPLDNAWLTEALEDLPNDGDRNVARYCLLTALAPYRVTNSDVTAAKVALGGDKALIQATIWAAFTAARRVCSWLGGVS